MILHAEKLPSFILNVEKNYHSLFQEVVVAVL